MSSPHPTGSSYTHAASTICGPSSTIDVTSIGEEPLKSDTNPY
jgi:hypothetical protein